MNREVDGWMGGQVGGWMADGWVEWMNGWVNEWIDDGYVGGLMLEVYMV